MPREGHDPDGSSGVYDFKSFQSTCPARGTTFVEILDVLDLLISIHVPREGHDTARLWQGLRGTKISIHVPREGHDFVRWARTVLTGGISIHVPREGHDEEVLPGTRRRHISIHVPREGHDARGCRQLTSEEKFQSTCPARGTTRRQRKPRPRPSNFNPRAPRGARLRQHRAQDKRGADFNPRAPRGARLQRDFNDLLVALFQSTCPARGTTGRRRTPARRQRFQSTCPARGTTRQRRAVRQEQLNISIHVPREGHDLIGYAAVGTH